MNYMRSLYIIFAVFLLCNIAVTGATSFDLHPQQHGMLSADTIDTVARRDSMVVDSLAKDSMVVDSLAKDSMVVDSLAKDSMVVDSLAKDSVAVVDSIITAPAKKRVYVHFKEKPQPDSDQKKVKGFIALYKKNLSQKTIDGYVSAYTPWKGAFESCNQRTLDMYMDGIAILDCMVRKDTANRKYDKLTERREQMMELYDLAVDNIADLNAQIDRKRTADTLSVAKLRAAQFNKYRDCWVLDSIFNSKDTLHNKYNDQNRKYWVTKLAENDSASLEFMYQLHKEIVFSADNNIYDPERYYFFAAFFKRYAIKKIKEYKTDNKYISNFLKPEFESIIEYTTNKYSEYKKIRKNEEDNSKILNNIDAYEGRIASLLNDVKAGFIGNDVEKLENHYNNLIAEQGGYNKKNSEDIINRNILSKTKVYYEALIWWYNNQEPSLDLALKIAKSAQSLKIYDQAAVWYGKIPDDELTKFEFSVLPNAEKAKIHYYAALNYHQFNKTKYIGLKLDNLSAAIEYYPQYIDAYYFMGIYMQYYNNFKLEGINKETSTKIKYLFAYDQFAKALKVSEEVNESPEHTTEIRNDISKEDIMKAMNAAKSNWPTKEDFFDAGKNGLVGGNYIHNLGAKKCKFTTRIRTSN